MPKRSKIVKLFFSLPLILAPLTLVPLTTSCSIHLPTFKATDDQVDWTAGTSASVGARWQGYYLSYVDFPPDKASAIDYEGHSSDIEIVYDDGTIAPHKNDEKKLEYSNIHFEIKTSKPAVSQGQPQENFSIKIHWTVRNTTIDAISTITVIQPIADIISFKSTFSFGSAPIEVQSQSLPTVDNSIDIVKNYYSYNVNKDNAIQISGNLKNDFIYWTYLTYLQLSSIWIDDSLHIYANIDNASWQVTVAISYNCETQIFDYLHISFSGTGNLTMFSANIGSASVSSDYFWGRDPSDPNSNLLGNGPCLLGAFHMNDTDTQRYHIPSYYDQKKNNQYSQNFLSLVPSSSSSVCLYDISVDVKSPIMTTTFGSGYHCYNLQQPRNWGLEFATGSDHISVVTQKHADAFKSMGFDIPSYFLSGIGYDGTNFFQQYTRPTINPCKVNINTTVPHLSNYINPGNATDFSNGFMFTPRYTDDKHDEEYDDWDFNVDDKGQTIPPDDFVAMKKNEFQKTANSVVSGWNNLQVSYESTNIVTLPWYQVLQHRGSKPGRGNGNNFAVAYNNDNNILMNDQNKFTKFAMGLNYMFVCDNMLPNSDNCFQYTGSQLTTLNNQYNNNPTP